MRFNLRVPNFWHDRRFWQVAVQAIAILAVVVAIVVLGTNLSRNLERLNLSFGFRFLAEPASFDIGETPIAYNSENPYLRAIAVGILNSLRVAGTGIILATIAGIAIGVARLSNNWLVRNLALVYVEVIRNTPLLLQLVFWYLVVFARGGGESASLPGGIYLTRNGLSLPWFELTSASGIWFVLLGGGAIAAGVLWRWRVRVRLDRGLPGRPFWWGTSAIAVAVLLALLIAKEPPVILDFPQLMDEETVEGGLRLSPEFAAIVLGLSVHSTSFIAEVVRGGIESVPKGQWEAARSLGLTPRLMMRLVVFPQALRVIVPPLTSEYLNLWKNSSLAIVIGYPDLYFVLLATNNQTGKAVEVVLLIAILYLGVGLAIASAMNFVNRAVQFES